MNRDVVVLGRFPPPIDGQTLATRRLADLLNGAFVVHRLNTSVPESGFVAAELRFRWKRVRHYLRLLPGLKRRLAAIPNASVLWTSVSPAPLGHWRDLLATIPSFRKEQRVYAVLHRSGFENLLRHPVTAPTARCLVRRLKGVVFLNEPYAARCAPWIPDAKRLVCHNTIDDELVCTDAELTAKRTARSGRNRLRLLFLSNLIKSKGYQDVLEAARLLTTRGTLVHVQFAGRWGSEADRMSFERLVAQLELSEMVTVHGPLADRAAVKALHLWADVFLLPSYYPAEVQPLALVEAMAAGTPAVVTHHGDLPSMVSHGREALLVPTRDPGAIAAAVSNLVDEETWQAVSERARRRFEEQYSPEVVRRQWERLLLCEIDGPET